MSPRPRVFLSYARQDGEAFATELCKRLEREQPEISLWQDRARMEGGVGWWQQIAAALDQVSFLVIVMTPAALNSEITRKEWRYARQQGVCVYPVKGVPDEHIRYGDLPNWMRKAHFFDLDKEWETFVSHLKSPCNAPRVPFMAPDLPRGFVPRPAKLAELLAHLLDTRRENPLAITTALRGSGGFGKTTLAIALCHDDEVITAFHDGILWVTLGETPHLQRELTKLYAALTGERPGFVDADDASLALAQKLADRNCLLVIDDVWDPAHLQPLLRGGTSCARLLTTRQFDVASGAQPIEVDEMTLPEAVRMLTIQLQPQPQSLAPFDALARRLREWPLLLKLAGAALRQRIERGDTLEGALDYVNRALDRRGMTAFDKENPSERHQAVESTVELSLRLLTKNQRRRCEELAIFPEDAEVPLAAAAALWGLDEFECEELVQELDGYSLVEFDARKAVLRLHDVLRAYFATRLQDSSTLHNRLLDAWGDAHKLPHAYAWRRIAYHLCAAGRAQTLRGLLLDFDWLRAKLTASDVNALITDYDALPADPALRSAQGALRLSAHLLARDATQLASQLCGRLGARTDEDIRPLLAQAERWRGAPWLRPLNASLTPPGGPLLRVLEGHAGGINAIAMTSDARRGFSASDDRTLKLWDLESGKEILTLTGHAAAVRTFALSVDAHRALSASDDGTLKLWDLGSGAELLTMRGHTERVRAVALSADGKRALSAGVDRTLRLWDVETGRELRVLNVHTDRMRALALSDDGRRALASSTNRTLTVWDLGSGAELRAIENDTSQISAVTIAPGGHRALSAGDDLTLRLWDTESGAELRTLTGDSNLVSALAVTTDGRYALSASWDGTLKLWDLESGETLRTHAGHTDWVTAVAITPDARRALSASADHTLKLWDLECADALQSAAGHRASVSAVALTHDGRRALSASGDWTLKLWDVESGNELATFEGHSDSVTALALSSDGTRVLSASADRTLKLWDVATGAQLLTLHGHAKMVRAVALSIDGARALSASEDRTLKLWDLASGSELCTLRGHAERIRAVALTRGGRHALSAAADDSLRLWQLESGRELCSFAGHTERIRALAVIAGRRALSGSDDGALTLWDLKRFRELRTFKGHGGQVYSLAASPDGRRVLSASEDRSLKLWDLEALDCVASFHADAALTACAMGPDARTMAGGDASGRVYFLRLEEPEAPSFLRKRAV